MESEGRRAWAWAAGGSVVVLPLVILFHVTLLDKPFSESWLDAAAIMTVLFLVTGFFNSRRSR